MKQVMLFILCLVSFFINAQTPDNTQRKTFLKKDSIKSSLDGVTQVFYFNKSTNDKPAPLIVQLHSWSFPADSLTTIELDMEASKKNYNYVFPNFRGVNNQPKACCSEFVIADIDEAIDWALNNMNVDKKRIYIIGYSGGGYATFAMYMKSRHNIRSFSAWCPISDIVAWYGQSRDRKNQYASQIIRCIGATSQFDTLKAAERSPIFWTTPLKKRKKSSLQIFAGIHDGYTGPVPISQSVNFYNKLLSDYKVTDTSKYVNHDDLKLMLETQTFPFSNSHKKLGDRAIYYQKSDKKIMLTIFEGGHEMLSKQALEYIDAVNGIK
ncbi:MAG: prolyl oligopeptidase family serine peptidase [Chitinophagaceae bacterium]